jgi:hypothetical protein
MEKLATLGSRIKWVVDLGWFELLDHFVNSGTVNLERRPNSWSLQVPNREKRLTRIESDGGELLGRSDKNP